MLPKYDALDPQLRQDPYEIYSQLRQAGPFCHGGPGQWVAPRYAEVSALLRDTRLGHQFPESYYRWSVGDGPAREFLQHILLYRDPPDHTVLRRLLAEAFGTGLFQRLRVEIGALVDRLLSPTLDADACELVGTLAFPLPVMVMCELLGVPVTDRELVRPRAMALAKAFNTSVSQEDRVAANEAVTWLRTYLGDLIDEYARHPRGDLLSRLAESLDGPQPLPREEVIDNAAFLLFAGFETTMNSLAVGSEALLRHPAEYARMRENPVLATSAVEEILRYDAPIQGVARIVRESIDFNGHTLPKGRVVVLLVGSANRDETQFADPHRFYVGRIPNRHVTFGGGAHQCFGAALARAELQALVTWLSRHVSRLEPADLPQRNPNAAMRSFISVSAHLRSC